MSAHNRGMRHLGRLCGQGTLSCDGVDLGPAEFEIDGYCTRPGEVVGSGEIRMTPRELDQAFGRRDLMLSTGDGRVLAIRFSTRRRGSADGAAHVDVVGGLPPPEEWRR